LENNLIHVPVLVEEVIAGLDLNPGKVVIDATIGDGGHAIKILKKINPGGVLIGIDRDPDATKKANENLSHQKSNVQLVIVHDSYSHLGNIIESHGYHRVDAILLDLGLSSRQLSFGRGFSFLEDAPLDMRFDSTQGITAAEIVNSYPKDELANIIWKFGEERASRRIADAIWQARRKTKITTTRQLADIVTVAKGGRRGRIHPATQTFQALRIAVNEELDTLTQTLPQAIELLNPQGRLAVISYHSLEDRIVKHIFRDIAKTGSIQLITKKPITPTREEIQNNPRSRSAKLRIITKLSQFKWQTGHKNKLV